VFSKPTRIGLGKQVSVLQKYFGLSGFRKKRKLKLCYMVTHRTGFSAAHASTFPGI